MDCTKGAESIVSQQGTGRRSSSGGHSAAATERTNMKAIEWLTKKLHIEKKEKKVGKTYYGICNRDTAIELEEYWSTYFVTKDIGYDIDDVLLLAEYNEDDVFTGKEIKTQICNVDRENEGLKEGYCILTLDNIGV